MLLIPTDSANLTLILFKNAILSLTNIILHLYKIFYEKNLQSDI